MLTIVIPALNEEASIEAVCRRCHAAAERIRGDTGENVEVIVIDDGSTDRTAELARSVPATTVLSLGRNRGYGAALMTGFRHGRGELLAFLDADGTCDPAELIPLIQAVKRGASIGVGNRMRPDSDMPAVRRVGNRFFAWLIGMLSGASVGDAGSGMRVIKREALDLLEPLPTGLHFTPAMTCRAALDPRLSITEVPITYAEREGRSKLGVVRDGLRFLRVILEIAVTYRPLRLFGTVGAVLIGVATIYAIAPIGQFLRSGTLAEDRIYRIVTIIVLTAGGLGFIYAGALADEAQRLVNPPRPGHGDTRLIHRPFLQAAGCFAGAFLATGPGLVQYLEHGTVEVHWAVIAFGALLALAGLQLVAFGVLQRTLQLLAERLRWRTAADEVL